jgi:hypothetical protein
LITDNPAIGKRIIQNSNWREEILLSLTEPFNRQTEKRVLQQRKPRSDFGPKEEIPLQREGWKSANSLRKELGIDYYAIKAFAEKYREEHPEWFEVQRPSGKGGPPSEHYHPELVEIIREHFKNKK